MRIEDPAASCGDPSRRGGRHGAAEERRRVAACGGDSAIALIGPNAVSPQILGGGSSTVLPHRAVTPLEGLEAGFPSATIETVRGCFNERYLPLIPRDIDARARLGPRRGARHLLQRDGARSAIP